MGFALKSATMSVAFTYGGMGLSENLWETCREAKATMQPRKTNQDIADESGLSVNAVGQFLRGETKSPSVDTVGPICAALGVSMDEHFGVENPAQEESAEIEKLQLKLDSAERVNAIYEKELRRRTVLIWILTFVVLAALLALLVDLCNPNVGWIRAAFIEQMGVLHA